MKIASVLMSLVFAGVVAQANETAPTAPATEQAAPVAAEKVAAPAKKMKKGHKAEKKAAVEAAAPTEAAPAQH